MKAPYESPEVKDLGSLKDLTLTTKSAGSFDGTFFDPSSIGVPGAPIPIGGTT